MSELRPFQREFIKRALSPGVDVAALSIPRGNGKSWLAAHLLERALTPGDKLFVPGAEVLLCAGSIEQARLCFRFIRANLEDSVSTVSWTQVLGLELSTSGPIPV